MEYLSIQQTSEKWVLRLGEYNYFVLKVVSLEPLRLDHTGLSLRMLKSQMIRGLRVESM